jgi:hypothetical protein
MNKAEFDRLFDEAFELNAMPPPIHIPADYRLSWQRVQQRMKSERKVKAFRSKLTKIGVIAASLLLGAAIFGNTQVAKAIDPIYATLKEYPSGVMGFFFGRADDQDTSKAKTAPPPGYVEGKNSEPVNKDLQSVIVTEEQARSLLSYAAPSFHFTPVGYTFSSVLVSFEGDHDKADSAAYSFINDKEQIFTVTMKKLKSNTALGEPPALDGLTVQKIVVNGLPAILMTGTDGSTALETIRDGIHITFGGIVPKKEVIRMYEEMYE